MKSPIRYSILPSHPEAHLFEVRMQVRCHGEAVQLALPAWIPGSYMIREFARHVVSIRASADGVPVPLEKLDKHTWRAMPVHGVLEIVYEVYAWDLSVRAAHLDQTHGFFNGSSVFLRVRGREEASCLVELQRPVDAAYRDWRVATSLREQPGRRGAKRYGFGLYMADSYDELIDHPVEMGNFELVTFRVGGIEHDIAVTGRVPNLDLQRLSKDLERVCAAQIAFFEPRTRMAPVDRYVFLVTAVGDGHGGLEHRASTALLCSRSDLPYHGMPHIDERYRSFLGLASHEYFHTWHVKRIKPAAFVPYDLDRESHTSLLWVFEGFTSYYDDLMLVRCGVINQDDFLKLLAKTIGDVQRAPGRLRQSVAESSFDAWTKYYRQDENSPNAIVSYYAKGALIALCLDLHIRAETHNKRSLDDVMRALWKDYGRDFYRGSAHGLGESDFVPLAERATGVQLARPVAAWAYSTRELPIKALLADVGLEVKTQPDVDPGGLGIKTKVTGDGLAIVTAYEGGAARDAGLSAGDTLLAVGGLRVARGNLDDLLQRYSAGQDVELHVFRRDELMRFSVRVGTPATSKCELKVIDDDRSRHARNAWLTDRNSRRKH